MTDQPYSKKIPELADKWISGSITEAEKQELFAWYTRFDDSELLLEPEYEPVIQALKQEMLAVIRQRIAADPSPPAKQVARHIVGMRTGGMGVGRIQWLRVAAAAVLLGAVATATMVIAAHRKQPPATTAQNQIQIPAAGDIRPGGDKAVLTLADGSNIALDSAHAGQLTKQGSALVQQSADGELKYTAITATPPSRESYNILSTPKGGQYRLVLPDGSKVWLNAASSIRFPTAFTGKQREVEIAGEAYFEIAKNASLPFRVLTVDKLGDPDPAIIQVLGTHFNVNAYADEPAVRTTLLEGLVKVMKGESTTLLAPGQEAQLQRDGVLRRIADADVEKAVAWKDGLFEFGEQELPVIMREISRWYNVEVVYEGPVPTDTFTGRVSRNTSLSGVLKILKLSDIQFTVSNNKIIVRS